MVQKSGRISSDITGKDPHNRKSSAMYNTNYWTDFDTFMYNGFQKDPADLYSELQNYTSG